ncbi:MAG: Maf family nucleotide pyrophosphatase [Steroidobacteraceae bacterium]
MSKRLILGSTSAYRRGLLQRLGLPFDCEAPGTDEAEVAGEAPAARAARLAASKAAAVAARFPDAWIIGSDQVASCDGPAGPVILDKPGTPERWRAQLALLSGRTAKFHTAVALHGPGRVLQHVDVTEVKFWAFGTADAERYMAREPALDCAGGFKAEGAGVALMERLSSDDPTAIVGLPLIWLSGALRSAGFALP